MRIKNSFLFSEIISIIIFSVAILVILKDKLYWYLIFRGYESFSKAVCFLIYYTIFSVIVSVVSGAIMLIKKH